MDSQQLSFVTTDVFTNTRYEGNPLAIVRMPSSQSLNQDQKQKIAREFNFSETVILHESAESDEKREWRFDIFMTDAEIPFAGHPTVGTIVYLGRRIQAGGATGVVEGTLVAKAGRLPFIYDTSSGLASAEIPHDSHVHQNTIDSEILSKIGASKEVVDGMSNSAAVVSIVKGMTFGLVELSSLEALGAVTHGYRKVETGNFNQEYIAGGLCGLLFYHVTEASGEMTRLRTRMVVEAIEDPATGSASSALAVWLASQQFSTTGGAKKVHKFEMTQGVEMGRRSVIGVDVTLNDQGAVLQVILSGTAVEITQGSICIP